MVTGTDCTGSCKSNYHMITIKTKTALILKKLHTCIQCMYQCMYHRYNVYLSDFVSCWIFYFFIILFCLLTIITLAQAAKLMKLHKNIIPFKIKHYFKFHNKSHNFFPHTNIPINNTTCINICYQIQHV